MTQEAEAEVVELAIVSCEGCDQLFLSSPRRQTCPTCGGTAGLTFFEFVGDQAGLHLKDGTLAAVVGAPAPPPAEATPVEPAPAHAEAPPPGEERGLALDPMTGLALDIATFLTGGGVGEAYLRDGLVALGAEPEAAVTAVGRLVAVYLLLSSLEGAGVEDAVDSEEAPSAEEAPPVAPPAAEGGPVEAPGASPAAEEQESGPSGGR